MTIVPVRIVTYHFKCDGPCGRIFERIPEKMHVIGDREICPQCWKEKYEPKEYISPWDFDYWSKRDYKYFGLDREE